MGRKAFKYRYFVESGTSAFQSNQAHGVVPTRVIGPGAVGNYSYMDRDGHPLNVHGGTVRRVHWQINMTSGQNYRLFLYQSNGGAANSFENVANKLFDSREVAAWCVDNEEYDAHELDRPFFLKFPGVIYYSIQYRGGPGASANGFLEVSGERDVD